MSDNKKIAIILAAHGEAETSRFIENYRVSRRTLEHAAAVMGVPPVLQVGISLFSALKKSSIPKGRVLLITGLPENRRASCRTISESIRGTAGSFLMYMRHFQHPTLLLKRLSRQQNIMMARFFSPCRRSIMT